MCGIPDETLKIVFDPLLLKRIDNSRNSDEFEKQVQTLERVLPLISKYRQTGLKESAALRIFKIQRKNTYSCLNYYLQTFENNKFSSVSRGL